MRSLRARWLTAAAVALSLAAPAAWANGLKLGAPAEFLPALREAAAIFVEQGGQAVEVHGYPHDRMMEFAEKGGMDVLVASCDRSGSIFAEKGFVDPATRGALFCRRMAVIVPPANPKGVRGLEDLDRSDLRWGMAGVCSWRTEDLRRQKGDRFVLLADDCALALDLLAEGRLDAVLTWDTAIVGDPRNFVAIRLPSSQYGSAFAALLPVFVTAKAGDPPAAGALVQFLSADVHARDVYLAHGYLLDDGRRAADYDQVAAERFQPVYEGICRQLVDDYSITRGVAIDIGCGPGKMDLVLARTTDLKVIGVDIEPEAVALARRNAEQAGLAQRMEFVCADAHSLPFPDGCADLIVSRGTLPFLRDLPLAIREVHRVLKPGGVAFLGGGMGRYLPPAQASKLYPKGVAPDAAMDRPEGQKREESIFPFPVGDFDAVMTRAGVCDYRVITEGGRWVEIRK